MELDASSYSVQTKKLLKNTTAENAIVRHMKPDDLAAVYKEGRGVKIYNYNGELTEHRYKANESIQSINNAIGRIHKALDKLMDAQTVNMREVEALEKKLSQLIKLSDTYSWLVQEATCSKKNHLSKP